MYQSTIILNKDIDAIYKLFEPESKDLGRASYTIKKNKNQLVFDITAEDATALKIVMNTLSKIFIIWEKTQNIAK